MPNELLSIKLITIADVTLLRQLSITTFRETFDDTNSAEDMARYVAEELNEAQLSSELEDKGNEFFIAYVLGEPAGYAKIRTTKMPDGLNAVKPMEVERLYVLAAYHGQRIGAGLMSHCMAMATGRGHDVVWLGVWEHNAKAIAFYKKWGFDFFGSHKFTLGSDVQTDLLMSRKLPQ